MAVAKLSSVSRLEEKPDSLKVALSGRREIEKGYSAILSTLSSGLQRSTRIRKKARVSCEMRCDVSKLFFDGSNSLFPFLILFP